MKPQLQRILLVLTNGVVTGAQGHFDQPVNSEAGGKVKTFGAGTAVPLAVTDDDTGRPNLSAIIGDIATASLAESAALKADLATAKADKAAAVKAAKDEAASELKTLQEDCAAKLKDAESRVVALETYRVAMVKKVQDALESGDPAKFIALGVEFLTPDQEKKKAALAATIAKAQAELEALSAPQQPAPAEEAADA